MKNLKEHLRRPLAVAVCATPVLACLPAHAGSIVSFQFESVVREYSEGLGPEIPEYSRDVFPDTPRNDFAIDREGIEGVGAASGFGSISPNGDGTNTTTYGAGAIAMDGLYVSTKTTATVVITNDTGQDANLSYLFQIFAGGLGLNSPDVADERNVLFGEEDLDWPGGPGTQPLCDVQNISRCREWLGPVGTSENPGARIDVSTDTAAEVNFSATLNHAGQSTDLFTGMISVEGGEGGEGAYNEPAIRKINVRSLEGNSIGSSGLQRVDGDFFDNFYDPFSLDYDGPVNYDVSWDDTLREYALGTFGATGPTSTAVLTLVAEAVASVDRSCFVPDSGGLVDPSGNNIERCAAAHAYWADPAGLGRRGGGISSFAAFRSLPGGPSLRNTAPSPIAGSYGPTNLSRLGGNNDTAVNGLISWTDPDSGRPIGEPQAPNAAPVPAPATLWLLAAGGALLSSRRLKRRR